MNNQAGYMYVVHRKYYPWLSEYPLVLKGLYTYINI